MTEGQYEGLCHIVMNFQGPEGEMVWDYYISEDGETGYLEMEMNGQTITQEWHAEE